MSKKIQVTLVNIPGYNPPQGKVLIEMWATDYEKVFCEHKDPLAKITAQYHLTEREKQTLRYIMRGLTSKEIAELMNISPNTVKAFLRLLMIKMGVTTRAGIVAKVLENTPPGEDDWSDAKSA